MMNGEQTNPTDTTGTKVDTPIKEVETDKTPSQKLKEENDALEVELIRAQKIRNEALLAGTGGGRVEPKEEIVSDVDYAKKAMSGEFNDKK